MKKIAVIFSLVLLSACGNINRDIAKMSGYAKTCVDGVNYLQFPSGAAVQVDREGKPVPC